MNKCLAGNYAMSVDPTMLCRT